MKYIYTGVIINGTAPLSVPCKHTTISQNWFGNETMPGKSPGIVSIPYQFWHVMVCLQGKIWITYLPSRHQSISWQKNYTWGCGAILKIESPTLSLPKGDLTDSSRGRCNESITLYTQKWVWWVLMPSLCTLRESTVAARNRTGRFHSVLVLSGL